jgi:hypothetical protein
MRRRRSVISSCEILTVKGRIDSSPAAARSVSGSMLMADTADVAASSSRRVGDSDPADMSPPVSFPIHADALHRLRRRTAAVEIVDGALDELAAIGCQPVDQASALIVSGLMKLDSIEDSPVVLATYKLLASKRCEGCKSRPERHASEPALHPLSQ